MQFRYPARLQPDPSGEITVSFRDFPECLTSGADESAALVEARDALEEAVAGRIDDDEPIPPPSPDALASTTSQCHPIWLRKRRSLGPKLIVEIRAA